MVRLQHRSRARRLRFRRRSMRAASDLLVGEQGEKALDLVDPRRRGRPVVVGVPTGPFGEPIADQLGLVARRVAHDESVLPCVAAVGVVSKVAVTTAAIRSSPILPGADEARRQGRPIVSRESVAPGRHRDAVTPDVQQSPDW